MIKLLLWASALVVVIAGLAGVGITQVRPEWGGTVVFFCGGVNLAAGWLAFLPVVIVQKKKREYLPQAVLAASVIRLMVVSSATLAAITLGCWATMPLSVWMILFYMMLLAVETLIAVRWTLSS